PGQPGGGSRFGHCGEVGASRIHREGGPTMPDGSLKLRGRVRAVLGDNIDTDIIYPGRYLNITDREKTAEHLFELAYPEMRAGIQAGDIIVAGRNFGCGSSRE